MYSAGTPFTPPQTGGKKRFVELSKYLCEYMVADLCCGDDDQFLGEQKFNRRYHFNEDKSKYSFLPPEANRLIVNKGIIKAIKKEKYDAVVSFDVPPTIGIQIFGIKNIVLMVRKDLIGYEKVIQKRVTFKSTIKLLYMWICEDFCIRHAKGIIVQCDYDKQTLLSRHPFNKKVKRKIFVQINNVNPSWIVREFSLQVRNDNNSFRVGFIGNFNDKRKGHDILLPVAERICINSKEVFFEIIGGGREYKEYRDKFESSQIRFYGQLDNPLEIIRNCNLVVVPSLADSCPNTVMEALFNGIPVIGSDRGGIPEILNNNSLEIFELNQEHLEARIRFLINNSSALMDLNTDEIQRKEELSFNWAKRIGELITSLGRNIK